jgi:hypothetical protein
VSRARRSGRGEGRRARRRKPVPGRRSSAWSAAARDHPSISPVPCRRSNRRRRPFIGRYGESDGLARRVAATGQQVAAAIKRGEPARDRVGDPSASERELRRERPSGRVPAISRAPTCSDLVSRAISRTRVPWAPTRASCQTSAGAAVSLCTDGPQARSVETTRPPSRPSTTAVPGHEPAHRVHGGSVPIPRDRYRPIVHCPQAQDG